MATPTPVTRLLVLVHEALVGDAAAIVRDLVADEGAVVHLVAPALATRTQYWFNDRTARNRAVERLDASRAALEALGLEVQAEVGDSDPLRALDDAVAVHRPQEVVVVTGPTDVNWLEVGIVSDARRRYGVPVLHLRVDRSTGAATVETASSERPVREHPL